MGGIIFKVDGLGAKVLGESGCNRNMPTGGPYSARLNISDVNGDKLLFTEELGEHFRTQTLTP